MKNYNVSYADLRKRPWVHPHELHNGSVVAYYMDYRTGIIVMDDRTTMLAALNYGEEGEIWWMDELPQNIELFEANEEEKLWGYEIYLNHNYGLGEYWEDCIPFIEHECPRADDDYSRNKFCRDFILHIPKLVERDQWGKLKEALTEKLKQLGGLQFNRFQAELYCLLMGVLMIAECTKDESERILRNKLLDREWDQFSWMYGICLGRVVGSKLHNFTGVVNQIGINDRKYYIHLYLPLLERYFDKIIKYNDDKPEKLRSAINKAKGIEEKVEQRTNLDLLFGILFPGFFHEAMSSSRPAATIAEMRKEMEEMQRKLSSSIQDFNARYEVLLRDFETLAQASVSFEEIERGLLSLSRGMAEQVLGQLSVTLADNKNFMSQLPKLKQAVKDNEEPKVNLHLELVNKKETNIDKNFGAITMNQPQFSGSMYDVSGNRNVNIGGNCNGEESK